MTGRTSPCREDCARPSMAQAHCPTCHKTFGGVTGFDKHRFRGACRDPARFGYESIRGVWRLPMPAGERARLAGGTG